MRRWFLTGIALLLTVAGARASAPEAEARLSRATMVENARQCSPNGRFCLVFHQFENLPDLGKRRADQYFAFPSFKGSIPAAKSWVFTQPDRGHFAIDPDFSARTAALYDRERRVAKIQIGFRWRGGEARVADSGRYVVLFCAKNFDNESLADLLIFRSDGSLVRRLFVKDLMSRWDPAAGVRCWRQPEFSPEIRENDDSGRDLLLLRVGESSASVRIDLATGERLGELYDPCAPERP